jgi:hypothetical protein
VDYLYAAACKLGILKKMGVEPLLAEASAAFHGELQEDPALAEALNNLPDDVREALA